MGGIILHPSKGSGVQVRLSAEGKLESREEGRVTLQG